MSSNNISAAKGIKHPVDLLTLGKRITAEEYPLYQYLTYDESWGEEVAQDLDPHKRYFSLKIDKNRLGDKDRIMLFDYNLDTNVWENVGYIIKKQN